MRYLTEHQVEFAEKRLTYACTLVAIAFFVEALASGCSFLIGARHSRGHIFLA